MIEDGRICKRRGDPSKSGTSKSLGFCSWDP
jgi:hypothetical protein